LLEPCLSLLIIIRQLHEFNQQFSHGLIRLILQCDEFLPILTDDELPLQHQLLIFPVQGVLLLEL